MASDTPTFSVIVRCFNRRDRVVQAVDSILAQTDQDFEIIVVDDASTDGGPAQLRAAYPDHPKLRLVSHPQNKGAAEAANTGVREARGRLIAFLDSDDTYLSTCLATHRRALENAPQAMMTYCDYVQVWEPYGFERALVCGTDDQDQRFATLKGGFIHSQSLIVVRREAFDTVGDFDPTLQISHDFDLWMRLALTYDQPFVHVREPLVRYTLSPDGVTKRYDRWWQEAKTVVARGKAHPNARPYLFDLEDVDKRLGANILSRQALEHWVRQRKDQSISVVVFVPETQADLASSMAALWDQDYRNFELIFVSNDAARPAAVHWYEEARRRNHSALVISGDLPPGALWARGLMAARGPLVAFLEADYVWHKDYLGQQVRAQSFPSRAPIFSCAAVRNGRGTLLVEELKPDHLSSIVMGIGSLSFLDLGRDDVAVDAAHLAAQCYQALEAEEQDVSPIGPPLKIARELVTHVVATSMDEKRGVRS